VIAERVIEICRYDADKDVLPYVQRFEVDIDRNDRMVLDVLVRLKSFDESISLPRSCREGIRGSSAININGANRLVCQTNMKELPSRIILRLLPGLPAIRHLIVGHDIALQAVSFGDAVADRRYPASGARMPAEPGRARSAGWPVRMLFVDVAVILGKSWQVWRSGRPSAGVPFHRHLTRYGHYRPPRQSGEPVSSVSLSHYSEPYGHLP